MTGIRPYADHEDDGIVQVSFTLPLPRGGASRTGALEVARQMGLASGEVVHQTELTAGYTYVVLYGRFEGRIDPYVREGLHRESMSQEEIDAFVAAELGRPIVVVGASTGSDTHSIGIDAMLNVKGFDGDHGLEGYKAFEVHNLGSQIDNADLLAQALEISADAIVVSQTVTQQDLHVHNLTELCEMVEAQGIRSDTVLVCGGPRISEELAKELGYDAGFSKGTRPADLATYLAREMAARAEVQARSEGG